MLRPSRVDEIERLLLAADEAPVPVSVAMTVAELRALIWGWREDYENHCQDEIDGPWPPGPPQGTSGTPEAEAFRQVVAFVRKLERENPLAGSGAHPLAVSGTPTCSALGLVPRSGDIVETEGLCLLNRGHDGPHVFRLVP